MMYLPRICEHCINPSCVASCPSGAMYKREEDGIVLVDQEACRSLALLRLRLPVQEGLLQLAHRQGREVHLLLPAHRGRACRRSARRRASGACATSASCSTTPTASRRRRRCPTSTTCSTRSSALFLDPERPRGARAGRARRHPRRLDRGGARARRCTRSPRAGASRCRCTPSTARCRWSGTCRRCRRSMSLVEEAIDPAAEPDDVFGDDRGAAHPGGVPRRASCRPATPSRCAVALRRLAAMRAYMRARDVRRRRRRRGSRAAVGHDEPEDMEDDVPPGRDRATTTTATSSRRRTPRSAVDPTRCRAAAASTSRAARAAAGRAAGRRAPTRTSTCASYITAGRRRRGRPLSGRPLKLLSLLLQYPDGRAARRARELREPAAELPRRPQRDAIAALRSTGSATMPAGELQARYVETFDFTAPREPATSPTTCSATAASAAWRCCTLKQRYAAAGLRARRRRAARLPAGDARVRRARAASAGLEVLARNREAIELVRASLHDDASPGRRCSTRSRAPLPGLTRAQAARVRAARRRGAARRGGRPRAVRAARGDAGGAAA